MNSPYLREGILLVNKERGKTSFDLVRIMRKKSNIQKIGHAGILDPFATGVMVLLIGRSFTKLAGSFIDQEKEYLATITLGESTDTFDCDGQTIGISSSIPTKNAIEKVLSHFQGKTMQVPPMFSAKKIGGKKLCDLARKGIEVPRLPVEVEMTITLISYSYPYLKLQICCSKGTYIRTLAHDIGQKLGTGAHVSILLRTRSGNFHLKDCIDSKKLPDPSFSYTSYLRREG